jgi:hypothetical protein
MKGIKTITKTKTIKNEIVADIKMTLNPTKDK